MAASLAACAHGGASKPNTSPAASGKNPCDLPNGWSFEGGCAQGPVGAGGATFRLKERHGIDVAVAFPSGSTRDAVPFVVGVALGRDIAGKLDGRMAFPHYRSVPCRDAQSKAVACAGKAPLYVAIYNDGNQPVVFDATPLIQIGRKGFFRGAGHCWLDTLQADRGGVVWVDHGKAVVPKADFVTFPSSGPSQSYNNGGAVTVLAAVCRRG